MMERQQEDRFLRTKGGLPYVDKQRPAVVSK